MGIEDKIKELIKKDLEKEGFIIIDVKYEKESNNRFLRIIIDSKDPVNLDDCLKATKIINSLLDKKDIIKNKYILDVCSNQRGGE